MNSKKDKQPNLEILKFIVCRSPVFSLEASLYDSFYDLKQYISEASPGFYALIKNIESDDLATINRKTFFSIWKYFNRSKFRATPFGRFAANTVVPIVDDDISQNVVLSDNVEATYLRDWDDRHGIKTDANSLVGDAQWFLTNATSYRVENEYRFLSLENSSFVISTVKNFEELTFILLFCRRKRSQKELYKAMQDELNYHPNSIKKLLIGLVECQLIWTDQMPNITGEDYYRRLGVGDVCRTSQRYILSKRGLISGTFNDNFIVELPKLVHFLNTYLPNVQNLNLEAFKTAFVRKFDRRAVPLSIALDPELGVGYANLSVESINNYGGQLSDVFLQTIKEKGDEKISYSPLIQFILNGLVEKKEVQVADFKFRQPYAAPQLPNTFSVLFRCINNDVVVEHIGGVTANALIGRFTLYNDELKRLTDAVAKKEKMANPEIIFFDVSYTAETHIDNINRRANIYDYELPLCGWSTMSCPLYTDDIYLTVQNDELVLFSKTLQKRLIPRIPTAYNYTRSKVIPLRFLSELQSQNIRTDLNINVRRMFPGLSYYSRVKYNNVILSPQMWLLPSSVVEKTRKADSALAYSIFRQWFEDMKIDTLFKVGPSDQTLTFNPNVQKDVEMFVMYCLQQKEPEIYLVEALVDYSGSFITEGRKVLSPQLLLNLYHGDVVHNSVDVSNKLIPLPANDIVQRTIPPGNQNWLFFQIYCHPTRSNEVVLERIAVYVKKYKDIIEKWFLVRFLDEGPHLRLRIKSKIQADLSTLIIGLSNILTSDLLCGRVSDMQLKTYVREIERYHASRIHLSEEFFFEDSKFLLRVLTQVENQQFLYELALTTMLLLIKAIFKNQFVCLEFVELMARNFAEEFLFDNRSYKVINREYTTFKIKTQNQTLKKKNIRRPKTYVGAFLAYIDACSTQDEIIAFTADAIHMHINRLFSSDQRQHEAILYQYLLKDIKTNQHHSKPIAE